MKWTVLIFNILTIGILGFVCFQQWKEYSFYHSTLADAPAAVQPATPTADASATATDSAVTDTAVAPEQTPAAETTPAVEPTETTDETSSDLTEEEPVVVEEEE